ncbi:hypothetical protein [Novosphingobium sp. G106]|nr:hypothetical protein [Novosphingobium sp. G106]
MRSTVAAVTLACLVSATPALAQTRLTPVDEAAAFRAAGFKKVGRQ